MAAAALVSDALLLGRARPRGRAALPPVRASARIVTRAALLAPPRVSHAARRASLDARVHPFSLRDLRSAHRSTRASGSDGDAAATSAESADGVVEPASEAAAAAGAADDADADSDASSSSDRSSPTFADLGLPKPLCAALASVGFSEPSLPQRAAIPYLLEGRNVALQSHTGSGKTMAYLLPVIARIVKERDLPASERSTDVQCLVVVPSQELAMQIVRQMERVLGDFGRSVTQQCIGGANVRRQEEAIRKKKPLVVVGTPGRLAELSRTGILRTHGVKCLVVDEADDLLASNFRRDMARITDHTGKAVLGGRQTVIVSATLKPETLEQYSYMAPKLLHIVAARDGETPPADDAANLSPDADDAAAPTASPAASLPANLEHYRVVADARRKVDRLRSAIHATGAERALVFLNFGHRLKDTRDKLATRGMACGVLHGGMNKMERRAELAKFKRGDFRALLVSDLAARGIDVPEVDAVFNLELPTDDTHYVHRAGRTGRMGAAGIVLTIAEPKETFVVDRIARALGVDIKAADLRDGALVPDRSEARPKPKPRGRGGESAPGRGGGSGGGQQYTPRGQPRRRSRKSAA